MGFLIRDKVINLSSLKGFIFVGNFFIGVPDQPDEHNVAYNYNSGRKRFFGF